MDDVETQIFSRLNSSIHAGAFFGSRARGEAREHSDYDVILVSPYESEGDFYFIPQNNLAQATHRVCIFYRTPAQIEKSINSVDEDWPVRNAPFAYNSVVFDPHSFFAQFQQQIKDLDAELFEDAFKETLYHAFEYLGKIKNNSDPIRTMEAARRFTDKLCKATALRNRHIYMDYCNPYPEVRSLSWAPAILLDNMEGMAGFRNWDVNRIVDTSLKVWDEYLVSAGLVPANVNMPRNVAATASNKPQPF